MQPTTENEIVWPAKLDDELWPEEVEILRRRAMKTATGSAEILNPPNREVWHVPVPGLANEEHTPTGFDKMC